MEVIIVIGFLWFIYAAYNNSGERWTTNKVSKGQIWEAKPRKQWSCNICRKIIYPGEIAYHLGDH